ncbi:MAG: dihydrodipicolinate synthase family protein [Acidimicrobiia bacterium]|nr:dihydrodipicolinate synthase family protein [Acidimicrobiia bacterium]
MRTPPHYMPALITPFDDDGDIILEAHAHNLRVQAERGAAGFVLGGSTGEGPYLEAGERALLLTEARTELGEEPYLVSGVSAQSVRQANAQVEESADGGADAALVLTPTSLARGNHNAVLRFFEAVAEAAPIPIVLYSVPAVTGYELPVDCVATLSEHPSVMAIKDSGGRPLHMKEIAQSTPEGFMVFAGSSSPLSQAMAAGAYGAITASGNYAPELVSSVVLTSQVSVSEAEPMQRRLSAATRQIEAFGVAGTKAAAGAAGLWTGIPRKPLHPIARTELARIAQVVATVRKGLGAAVAG